MSQAPRPKSRPSASSQLERIAGPLLPFDRHDVGMAGEDDAAVDHRPDRRQQRGLVAGRVGRAQRGDALAAQIVLDEVDQRQIAFVAFGIERHQAFEQRDRAWPGCRRSLPHLRLCANIGRARREGESAERAKGLDDAARSLLK